MSAEDPRVEPHDPAAPAEPKPLRARARTPKRYVGRLVLSRADDDGEPAETVVDLDLVCTAGHDLEALAFSRLELEDALSQVLRTRVARN